MKFLKESKETLPISFITDFISKGWEEVGYLKADIEAIKDAYTGTKKIEDLIQDLIDAYLVCIGQLELHITDKKYLDYPEESGLGNMKKESLSEDIQLVITTKNDEDLSDEDLSNSDFQNNDLTVNDAVAPTKTMVVSSDSVENKPLSLDSNYNNSKYDSESNAFEYFVDFDEPDMSEPRITDKDLYDED